MRPNRKIRSDARVGNVTANLADRLGLAPGYSLAIINEATGRRVRSDTRVGSVRA